MSVELDLRDDPRRAARLFGVLCLVAVALAIAVSVLMLTGDVDGGGGPPPARGAPVARDYV